MKIRNGFVSNSSSSSFVVSVDPVRYEHVKEFVELADDPEVIRTLGELETYAKKHYSWRGCNDEELRESCFYYDEAEEAIENGKIVVIADIEHGDYTGEKIMNALGELIVDGSY